MSSRNWIIIVLVVLILGAAAIVLRNENVPVPGGQNATSTTPEPGTRQVSIFLLNNNFDPEITCTAVFPVKRSVPDTPALGRAAIEALLAGPTPAEKEAGYYSSIQPGVEIKSISIRDGIATVDFTGKLEEKVGGSCLVSSIRAQITQTLKQFPSVDTVLISVEGRVEDALQP